MKRNKEQNEAIYKGAIDSITQARINIAILLEDEEPKLLEEIQNCFTTMMFQMAMTDKIKGIVTGKSSPDKTTQNDTTGNTK